ncbi:MAG: D-glycero-beta-D-manno-heptose 1-phosphate adenylyltransferase [Thermodesulfobacteriota bacterium]
MGKVISLRGLLREIGAKRGRRKKVVFTNGCFDIIHAGHVRYLKKAKSLGDVLVVGLNSDSSVRKLKGRGRPVVPEGERAEVLSTLEPVDYVVIFKEPTPIKLIEAVRPDVLVKGADWKSGEIVGEDVVKGSGGRVARVRLLKGRSTTDIIKRVSKLRQSCNR